MRASGQDCQFNKAEQGAGVIMLCGKICSGKTHYAKELRSRMNAVILSVDEIMLTLFPEDLGDEHEKYVQRAQTYIFAKSPELVEAGNIVILDCGFWSRTLRDHARDFYESRGIPCELHYLEISKEKQLENVAKRNAEVAAEKTSAYFVDEGLLQKCDRLFEEPTAEEIVLISAL